MTIKLFGVANVSIQYFHGKHIHGGHVVNQQKTKIHYVRQFLEHAINLKGRKTKMAKTNKEAIMKICKEIEAKEGEEIV